MPERMNKLLDLLGVNHDVRTFENALFGSNSDYGVSFVDVGKGLTNTLFPPLRSDF